MLLAKTFVCNCFVFSYLLLYGIAHKKK
ncbi:hypothetical protein LIS81_28030 (plasmid) [Bacillus tropicus]|nr:hypothetical protein LIS81_28030 [Bacillus tropicus]